MGIFKFWVKLNGTNELLSTRDQNLKKNPNWYKFIYKLCKLPSTTAFLNFSQFIFVLLIIIVNIKSSSGWGCLQQEEKPQSIKSRTKQFSIEV